MYDDTILAGLHTGEVLKQRPNPPISALPNVVNGTRLSKWDVLTPTLNDSHLGYSILDLRLSGNEEDRLIEREVHEYFEDLNLLSTELGHGFAIFDESLGDSRTKFNEFNSMNEETPEEKKRLIHEAIQFGGDEDLQEKMKKLIDENSNVFASNLRECEPAKVTPLKIEFEDRSKWEHKANQGKVRPQPDGKRKAVKEKMDEMVKSGVIELCDAKHYSQIHLVMKPDGKYRFTVDFRQLNACIKSSSWPIPKIQDIFQDIGATRPRYFCIMDMTEGYYQLPLDEASRDFTAMYTTAGLYRWKRVPMGLKHAGIHFQKMIETEVLHGIVGTGCAVYQDDVCVYASTKEELLTRMSRVLERFQEYGVKLKPSKCKFGLEEVNLLGHVINQHGTTFSRTKLQGVIEFERPTTAKMLHQFLGLINYYRSHVYMISDLTKPLYDIMKVYSKKKGQKIDWTPEGIQAFEAIKKAVWELPTLFFADNDAPIFLQTDASDYGIAGYIYQMIDGKEVIIGMFSRSLRGAETRWSTFEKECFAIYMSMRKFYYLLADRKFIVKTDHRNLLFLNNEASPKVINWKMDIQMLDFEIEHVDGVSNVIPDVNSRVVHNFKDNGEKLVRPVGSNVEMAENLSQLDNCSDYVETSNDWMEGVVKEMETDTETLMQLHLMNLQPEYHDEILMSIKQSDLPMQPAWEYLKSKQLDNERYDLIAKYHNGKVGHVSESVTMERILEHEDKELNNIRRDVATFIAQCHYCQARKIGFEHAKVKPFNSSVFGPMERIAIDTIGPLKTDKYENMYIIVMIDVFSRFISLYPVSEITAMETRRVILMHVGIFGVAQEYIFDRGRQYDNNTIDELITWLKSGILKTRGGSHEENGVLERANREVIKHLTAIIHEEHVKELWSTYLPLVARIMNSLTHSSTGVAPSQIIFGNNIDLDRNILAYDIKWREADMTMSEFMNDMIKAQKAIINKATQHQHVVNNKYISKKTKEVLARRDNKYIPGSFVMVTEQEGRSNKLSFRHNGPFRVIEQIDDIVKVQDLITDNTSFYHVNYIKEYKYNPNRVNPVSKALESAIDPEFIVGEILDHRRISDGDKNIVDAPATDREFLVHWEDFTSERDSWEPWKEMIKTQKVHHYLYMNGMKKILPKDIKKYYRDFPRQVNNPEVIK